MYNLNYSPMVINHYNQSREHYLQTVVTYHQDAILLVNENGEILFANQIAEDLLKLSVDQIENNTFPFSLKISNPTLIEYGKSDQEKRTLEMTVQPAVCQDRPVYLVTLKDITGRVPLDQKIYLASQAFESTPEGIFITDAQGHILVVNRAFSEITGFTNEEVQGKEAHHFHSDQRDGEFYLQMWKSLSVTGAWQGEIWNRRKDGEIYPEWVTISTIKDGEGNLSNYIVIFTDISSRKHTEDRLRFLATHDPLTGLPNRELFHDRLDQAIMRARRAQSSKEDKWHVAVMLLDLDNFKTVNDSLGHAWGDRVLIEVAQRLQNCVRKSDSVARLGGDEFTIILEGVANRENCELVANKVLHVISQPFELNGENFVLGTSIGISIYPTDGEDGETLLKHADVAMYRAKQTKGCYTFFNH